MARLPFRIGFNTDQHLPYEALLERWLLLEELGFDNAWVADHLLPWWTDELHRTSQQVPWDDGVSGDDTDFLEGWTLVAALLSQTTRIRGGVLVSDNLLRHPAIVAKMAVTVDQISGGRFELGMGAGWFEPEHTAWGFAFPRAGERVDRLEESLAILDSLMTDPRTTFHGQYYQIHDAPLAPKPVNGRVPIVVGASGPRMLRLVARYADTWSCEGSPDDIAARGKMIAAACSDSGRDPDTIRWSFYGYPATIGGDPLESADAFIRLMTPYRDVGVTEIVLELPDDCDERVLRAIAESILPEWRGDTT